MKREKKVFLRDILLIVISVFLSYKVQAQCTTLVWSDEFNGTTLNTSNWNYNVGNPGVNNELENYTNRSQNVSVSGGNLNITALQESYGGSSYTSGKLNSQTKKSFKYGRFEASIKLPSTQGLWPAFWMMPETSVYGGWPQSGEIDIMEEQGSNPYKNFGTIHYGSSASPLSRGGTYIDTSDLSAGFHTYAVEWKPDTINWYLDNHNYYTVTASSISPRSWPFDQNFYIILNLAVGGWFGGNPDGTTVFPQTMEVDYVRVYSNSYTIFINGKDEALENETYTYSVSDSLATSYLWTVPSGSSIVSGQGTSSIQVTWGSTSGLVAVAMTTASCGTKNLSKNIPVIANGCNLVFDDFESNRLIVYNNTSSTGTAYNPVAGNPSPTSTVNSSSTVAFYTRNATVKYDLLYYSTDIINNSVDYENGNRTLYMDVYTSAPIGTKINWQLENQKLTAQTYPSGRRAVFLGTTTVQNQWEKIKFTFSSTPDLSTPSTSIDQFTFLFDPGNYTKYSFYFDNLMRTDNAACTATGTQTEAISQQNIAVSPNPAHDQIAISMSTLSGDATIQISLIDMLGREYVNQHIAVKGTSLETSINVSSLSPGMYMLLVQQGESNYTSKKIIIQ